MGKQAARKGARSRVVSGSAPKKRDAEVLAAAARVFHERGYAAASVQDVADELGILKGSVYHYIKTKEDLLFQLLQVTHDEIYEVLEEVSAMDDLQPLERLELYVRRQVEYNLDNVTRVTVYYNDVGRLSPERRKRIYARRREHEKWVVELIDEAKSAGQADPIMDSKVLSRCIFATIIWPYRWYNKRRHDRQTVTDVCVAFAMAGVVGAS